MAPTLAHIHRPLLLLLLRRLLLLVPVMVSHIPSAMSQAINNVTVGSYLVATNDSLPWAASPSGDFAFGFRSLPGQEDQFLLAIWFAKIPEKTIVWSANRDHPADRDSIVKLTISGQLVLTKSDGLYLWGSDNTGNAPVSHGAMFDTGNLVITSTNSSIIWESFKNPTNTILPAQVFGVGNSLLSSRSESNYQQGKFQLRLTDTYDLMLNQIDVYTKNPYGAYYRDQNVLELILDKSGYLQIRSSPSGNISNLTSESVVNGEDSYYRVTLDFDGVFRLYAHPKKFNNSNQSWSTVRFVPVNICLSIFDTLGSGPCGYNSICALAPFGKINCQCPPGFSLNDVNDKYGGCKPDNISYMQECDQKGSVIAEEYYELLEMEFVDWPLADYDQLQPTTEYECRTSCLRDCFCAVAIFQDPKYNDGIDATSIKQIEIEEEKRSRILLILFNVLLYIKLPSIYIQ